MANSYWKFNKNQEERYQEYIREFLRFKLYYTLPNQTFTTWDEYMDLVDVICGELPPEINLEQEVFDAFTIVDIDMEDDDTIQGYHACFYRWNDTNKGDYKILLAKGRNRKEAVRNCLYKFARWYVMFGHKEKF